MVTLKQKKTIFWKLKKDADDNDLYGKIMRELKN